MLSVPDDDEDDVEPEADEKKSRFSLFSRGKNKDKDKNKDMGSKGYLTNIIFLILLYTNFYLTNYP
jgi:hypothetical protein